MAPFTGQQGAVPKLKLTCLGVTVEINKSHYDKLRLLYARTAGSAAHDATAFTHAAMALLLRYSSLQGTHYRGGGFQVRRSHHTRRRSPGWGSQPHSSLTPQLLLCTVNSPT